MPNSNTAKKRLRQNVVRRTRNRATKSSLRTQIRKVDEAVAAGNVEASEKEFLLAVKSLDRAASAKVIHPNTAARKKSRLSAAVKATKAAGGN